MNDRYFSFEDLAGKEVAGVDYEIECVRNGSEILIMAPHGGKIEFLTCELAAEIAENNFSFYAFRGIKENGNRFLHITSHLFNEPLALKAASEAQTVLAVHGARDDRESFVMIGGLDCVLVDTVRNEIRKAGFKAKRPDRRMGAVHPDNICNRGKRRKGVQLELSRKLRKKLKEDRGARGLFVEAVRSALVS